MAGAEVILRRLYPHVWQWILAVAGTPTCSLSLWTGLPPNVEALTSYVTAEGSRGGCPNGTRQPPYCLS